MKFLKQPRFYLLVMLTALLFYFTTRVSNLGVPFKFLALIVLVFLTILSLVVCLCYQKRRWIQILGVIITILSGVGVYYGSTVFNDIYKTISSLDDGANKSDKIVYSLILNQTYDADAGEVSPQLSELANKKFGVLEMGNTSYNRDIVASIREELGEHIGFDSIKNYTEATQKLQSGEIEALIINEAIRDVFEVDLNTISTVIKTYEFEEEKDVIRNPTKVTSEPFVVYITGIDTYGGLGTTARSDVNKIGVINPLTKDILLIDIPRDFYVPISCLYNEYDKLTHSGFYGPECTVETMSNYMGLDINYYARVNFSSVIQIIDALNGIDVDSKFSFRIRTETGVYSFTEGINHMNGEEALAFCRERYDLPGGDFDRIKNQTAVLKGAIKKMTSPAILSNYKEVLDVLVQNIETNMPSEDIIALINMQLSDMATWNIESFSLRANGTYDYSAMMGQELYMGIPDEDSIIEAKALINEIMSRVY